VDPTSKELVKKHYTEYVAGECERFAKDPYHRLEFDSTMHFLRKHLPKKGSVLNAGRGPERYGSSPQVWFFLDVPFANRISHKV